MARAPNLAGFQATGKSSRSPGFDIHELVSDAGLRHTALLVQDAWRTSLGPDLAGRIPFMEQPEVAGLARLAQYDAEQGLFLYPTGTAWSVAEVIRFFADTESAAGVKAGLELCYLVAESLVEAAEQGFAQGVFGHGSVSPWTLWLKQDGQPLILGYGLPQVELVAWRENPKLQLTEDSFRYAPAERVEGGSEDVSSDLLSLALVSLELMVGRPVYDGVVADVRQQAVRGEGVRRLYQWREKLPQNVREVMSRALKADPDTRFPSGMDFVHAVHDLLGSIDVEGPSLVEVMAKVRASQQRGRVAAKTGALTADQMAVLAADLEDFEDRPLPPPRRPREEAAPAADVGDKPRWAKVQRSSGVATPAPAPEAERPRRRLRGDGPPTATVTRPDVDARPAPLPPGDDPRERLRRRLRESAPQGRASDGRPSTADVLPPAPPPAPPTAPVAPPSAPVPLPHESGELDLTAPDDVQLEPLTGKPSFDVDETPDLALEPAPPRTDTGKVLASARAARTPAPAAGRSRPPPPPAPDPEPEPAIPPIAIPPPPPADLRTVDARPDPAPLRASTGLRPSAEGGEGPGATSAAAALLERLRTSGGRRRRAAGEVSRPLEPPRSDPPPPTHAPRPEPPPRPDPVTDVVSEPPRSEAAAAPRSRAPEPARRPVPRAGPPTVRLGERVLPVAPGPAREVAARAAAELALPTVDLTGRFSGVWRLFRGDEALPPTAPVGEGDELHLRRIRTGVRPVRIALPDGRLLELPLETGLPARWILVGLAEWGLLPEPDAELWLDGRSMDAAETLAEALDGRPANEGVPPLVSIRPNRVS